MGVNYEYEMEELIFNNLKYIYGINDNDVLYRYLKLRNRCITFNFKKKEEIITLCKFLLESLHIIEYRYKEETIYLTGRNDNSIKNIIDSFEFRSQLKLIEDENKNKYSFDDYIEKIWKDINDKSMKKSKHYIKDPYYKYHIIYNRLKELNKLFGVNKLNEVRKIDGFVQDLEQTLHMEDICIRYIHLSGFNTNNIKSIREEDLEEYLFKNLNLIEEGLKPISRQFQLEEGRIDILAKDKNDNFVILELKINNDKHLIWQAMYYPEAISNIFKVSNPRIITICPFYPNYIKSPLKKIGNVEMFQYNATISNSKIININFKKIS